MWAHVGLVARLRAEAPAAFEGQPVVAAYLFGSRAVGRPRPDSDADVAVLLDDGLAEAERSELALRLGQPLERAAASPVDVVILNDAPLPLRGRILQQRILLYSRDDGARAAYESLTLRQYWDFLPRLQAMSRAYLEAVSRGVA